VIPAKAGAPIPLGDGFKDSTMISDLTAGLRYYRAGRLASRELPTVRAKVWKGFFLSLLLLLVVGGGIGTLLGLLIFAPMKVWLLGRLPEWATWVGATVAVLAGVSLAVVGLVSSLRFTVILLGFFFESAVADVVAHFRPDSSPGKGGPSIIWEISREVFYFIILVLLPLIPVAGAFIAMAFSSWLVGKGLHAPHKNVLMDRGLTRDPPSHVSCLSSGVAEILLILIPFVGWLILPWAMIHMVIGQTWIYEEAHSRPTAPSVETKGRL